MKKLVYTSAFCLALALCACSGNGSSQADSDSIKETVKEAEMAVEQKQNYKITDGSIVSANGLPMIVDFSAEWCPPCRQLKPIFESLKNEYAGKVDFVTINVDSMPLIATKYSVESIPNMVYISKDGTEVFRSVGFVEAAQIKADIAKYLEQ